MILTIESEKGEPDEVLFVLGADHVTAHDAADGRELWRVGGLNPTGHKYFRSIASPVVSGDFVIAPYARGETITELAPDGQVKVHGEIWKARAADGTIAKGTAVTVDGVDGLTLTVRSIQP